MMSEIGTRFYKEGFRPLRSDHWKRIHKYEAKIGQPMQENEEYSAGCIVFSHFGEKKELKVLLIEQSPKWYYFPKGHLNENEDNSHAAIRETMEETGICLQPENLGKDEPCPIRYSIVAKYHHDKWIHHPLYPNESERPLLVVHKTVTFFPAYLPVPQEISPQLSEVISAGWFTIPEAECVLDSEVICQLREALDTDFIKNLN